MSGHDICLEDDWETRKAKELNVYTEAASGAIPRATVQALADLHGVPETLANHLLNRGLQHMRFCMARMLGIKAGAERNDDD
jgi:hypothetical protein